MKLKDIFKKGRKQVFPVSKENSEEWFEQVCDVSNGLEEVSKAVSALREVIGALDEKVAVLSESPSFMFFEIGFQTQNREQGTCIMIVPSATNEEFVDVDDERSLYDALTDATMTDFYPCFGSMTYEGTGGTEKTATILGIGIDPQAEMGFDFNTTAQVFNIDAQDVQVSASSVTLP